MTMIQRTTKRTAFAFAFMIIFIAIFASADTTFIQNIQNSTSSNPIQTYSNANLVVQTLKYNPYPVSAGQWFDVWIQVQNIGQQDAKNVHFQLLTDYPFTDGNSRTDSSSSINYQTILGTLNSYKLGQSTDTTDANTVILRYRVFVADNAPTGTSNLKLQITQDSNNPSAQSFTVDLPIVIGDTKTDFDVVLQDSSSQGTSFSIANTGNNAATAVVLTVIPSSGLNVTGATSSILGNLNSGDFTTVTYQIFPTRDFFSNPDHNLQLKVAYTDTAGVRNQIYKNVTLNIRPNLNPTGARNRTAGSSDLFGLSWYLWFIIGIIVGILIVFIYRKFKKKK